MEQRNMKLVETFDPKNKIEATNALALREKYHKQGINTAVVKLLNNQNKRIAALFSDGELDV